MDLYQSYQSVKNATGKEILDKTREAAYDITSRLADLVVAAFGIVSALAFNDAVKSLFAEGGFLERFARGGPWVAAVFIMLLALLVGYWRTSFIPKPENKPLPIPSK